MGFIPDERDASSNHSLRLGFGPLEKLSPGKSALFADHSLSEPLRGEFELSVNAFSRFSGA